MTEAGKAGSKKISRGRGIMKGGKGTGVGKKVGIGTGTGVGKGMFDLGTETGSRCTPTIQNNRMTPMINN